jgi:hypothetical protein
MSLIAIGGLLLMFGLWYDQYKQFSFDPKRPRTVWEFMARMGLFIFGFGLAAALFFAGLLL